MHQKCCEKCRLAPPGLCRLDGVVTSTHTLGSEQARSLPKSKSILRFDVFCCVPPQTDPTSRAKDKLRDTRSCICNVSKIFFHPHTRVRAKSPMKKYKMPVEERQSNSQLLLPAALAYSTTARLAGNHAAVTTVNLASALPDRPSTEHVQAAVMPVMKHFACLLPRCTVSTQRYKQ